MKRKWLVSAIVAGLSILLTQVESGKAAEQHIASPVGLADGPGIWVNLWSYPTADVESYALKLHNNGIRNVFVQTSRSNTPAIRQPEVLGPLIDACHHYKIRVIAWSFLELGNPEADAQKLIEAARFRSATGQTFDAIAPNMEKDLDSTKVERLSKALRAQLGPTYPMIAVVYSPLNKAAQVAKTPWKLLDKYYDVIAPMDYWNSKFAKLEPYSYTRDTVKKVRELCGRPDVEIHIIGDGMKTHGPEIKEFMRACRDTSVTSASLYPFHQMTEEQYVSLNGYHEYFPVNSRYRLAAFHELIKSGAMTNVSLDPSKSIPRGEFYRLVAHRLTGRKDLQDSQAINILLDYGVVPDEHKDALANAPLYVGEAMEHREAYAVVANAVEAKNRAHKLGLKLNGVHPVKLTRAKGKRVDWFSLPAQAQQGQKSTKQMLNYIDAAHIVLSADHDLR
ncbi:MAG: hypothetical protein SGJ27_04575 [Candidatus Melainabacteria bacterium]|nr:hypothetical protein [Candidatus Melainabacteria bacterium]